MQPWQLRYIGEEKKKTILLWLLVVTPVSVVFVLRKPF